MPYKARPRLPRRRHAALQLEADDHSFSILLPHPDEPLVVAGFGDAVALALDAVDMRVDKEVLVLLNERREITALLLGPPADVGVFIGMADLPGLETPFCQTLSIVVDSIVQPGPPSEHDRIGYHALRRAHMAQGLLLLDVLISDGDNVRSLAIGCDPDPVWFDDVDLDADDARDPTA